MLPECICQRMLDKLALITTPPPARPTTQKASLTSWISSNQVDGGGGSAPWRVLICPSGGRSSNHPGSDLQPPSIISTKLNSLSPLPSYPASMQILEYANQLW